MDAVCVQKYSPGSPGSMNIREFMRERNLLYAVIVEKATPQKGISLYIKELIMETNHKSNDYDHTYRKKICFVQHQRFLTFIYTDCGKSYSALVLVSLLTRKFTQETNCMYAINVRKPSTQIQHSLYLKELIKETDYESSDWG